MISRDKILQDYLGTFKTMKLFEQEKKDRVYGGPDYLYDGQIDWLKGWQSAERWILEIKDGEYCECCGEKKEIEK